MIESQVLSLGNEMEMECLWFCFAAVIQKDLDVTKKHWNTHYIRKSHYNTVSGRPDELFYTPESYGGEDNLLNHVPLNQIQFVSDNLLQFEEEENLYQNYFQYLFDGLQLQKPSTWQG